MLDLLSIGSSFSFQSLSLQMFFPNSHKFSYQCNTICDFLSFWLHCELPFIDRFLLTHFISRFCILMAAFIMADGFWILPLFINLFDFFLLAVLNFQLYSFIGTWYYLLSNRVLRQNAMHIICPLLSVIFST